MTRTTTPRTSGSATVVQYAEAAGAFGYVYAIGRIRHFFPTKDIHKMFCQLDEGGNTNQPEEQRLQAILTKNPYFAREIGWVFQIQDVDTYVLSPRTTRELDELVASLYPPPSPPPPLDAKRYDFILGTLAPLAGVEPEGADLPSVVIDLTEQFTVSDLASSVQDALRKQGIQTLPTPTQIKELFEDTLQLADNTGDADELRALNYVSYNYPDFYIAQYGPAAQGAPTNVHFSGIEARRASFRGGRVVIDVILRYENRTTGITSSYYTSVDVTGKYPFLVTLIQPYFER